MTIEYKKDISVQDYNFLRKSVGWNEININQAKVGISNSLYLITANNMNETIGLVRVVGDGGYIVVIVDVIVLPEYQGKGIGKSLIQKIMELINNDLNEGESVFVNLMAAKGKEPFYRQVGFNDRPNEIMGCGMTQWIRK